MLTRIFDAGSPGYTGLQRSRMVEHLANGEVVGMDAIHFAGVATQGALPTSTGRVLEIRRPCESGMNSASHAPCRRKALRLQTTPAAKHGSTPFWWRETELEYGEGQFVAAISKLHPILSLGVSVEKGVTVATASRSRRMRLDPSVWDWRRLVDGSFGHPRERRSLDS